MDNAFFGALESELADKIQMRDDLLAVQRLAQYLPEGLQDEIEAALLGRLKSRGEEAVADVAAFEKPQKG